MKKEVIKVIIDKENNDVSVGIELDNIIDAVMAWGLAANALKETLAEHYIAKDGIREYEAHKKGYNFLSCALEHAMNIKKNNPKAKKDSREYSERDDKKEYIRELKRRRAIYRDLYIDSGDEDYVDKANSCNRMLRELLKNEQ